MNGITVCVIRPDGYLYSHSFDELADLLVLSLRDLGYSVEITANRLNPTRFNLLLGYHILPYFEEIKNCRFVAYQLEPFELMEEAEQKNALQILQAAEGVWDYSPRNIQFLKKYGVHAELLPPGYHPGLDRIPRQEPMVDALFYGAITSRRLAILEKLVPKCRVKILNTTFGAERDLWIGKSRSVLNLHRSEQPLFETVRISYLWNNRIPVWSEPSDQQPYEGVDFPGVAGEAFTESFIDWLESKRRIEDAERTAQQFKTLYPMTRLLEDALTPFSL